MPRNSTSFNEHKTDLDPPTIIGVLPAVPDGEDNLLPKDAWLVPLRIAFALWSDSAQEQGQFDTVELFWRGEAAPVHQRKLEGPIPETELWLEVPVSKLDEGVHSLYYRVLPWNGSNPRECLAVNVTIDKTAPILAIDSKLIFPPAVLPPNQITAAYLADPAHEDQVLATLPEYTPKKVGDVITWYWERSPGGREIAGTKTLERDDLGKAVQVAFKGELLRQSTNNLDYYASSRVRDRAGNETVLSADVKLNVNIRPPTPRKFPTVEQATSTPSGTGVLNPFRGTAGVTVEVGASEVDPGEEVTVDFVGLGGVDGIGSVTGVKPILPGGLKFTIPAAVVAANIPVGGDGRKVEVRYWAGHDVQHSAVYTLTINELAGEPFGTVNCPEAQIGSPAALSKSKVALSGANIEIEKWAYHEGAQRINVWAIAAMARTDFLTNAPTPINDKGMFTTPLPKDYVAALLLNSTFTLYASVSFDQGYSYRGFKSMVMKLIT